MFSDLEYATVVEYIVYKLQRTTRTYKMLFVKFPNNRFMYCFKISASVDVPDLEKGDTVKIKFDLHVLGKSTVPQYKVVKVIRLF